MPILKNRLSQRILINLPDGKTCDLMAQGSATLSDKELLSTHVEQLVKRGDLVILDSVRATKTVSKNTMTSIQKKKRPSSKHK